jgi:hypothetical protein
MVSLVGHRQGRKIIRWGYVFLIALLISIVSALVAGGLYAAFTREWNPLALFIGPAVGTVATTLTLLTSLSTPVQRLPML